MKRDGYIIEEIVEQSNIEESFDYIMRGTHRKKSRSGRYLMRHREEVIQDIIKSISDATFEISAYKEYTIVERGKERTIQCIPLKDRIVLNGIMRVVEKHLDRRFISDSAASIKNRGSHYLHQRMMKDMRDNPHLRYVYKCDIRKFYQNIDQEKMIAVLEKYFKDKRLILLLSKCIRMLPKGLSIGLRTSQALGNLYLNEYVDHYIKDKMGVRHYRRYCDDIVVQCSSYYELTPCIKEIRKRVELAGLEIKGNEQVFDIRHRDINFLGLRSFGDGKIEIRKHIKHRFAKRWKRVRSRQRKQELLASFYGISKHADAKHLFKTITGISMRSFKDFGFSYTASDGKKRFDCATYSLGDLMNRELIVKDYEKGIKTKEGDGRYVIHFTTDELGEGKFFTNSDEMKQMLDKISETPDGFPFRTTIKRKLFGQGKVMYLFT